MIDLDFEERIDAYEAALFQGIVAAAQLADYLPSKTAKSYYETLVELLRITLEHAWQGGCSEGIEAFRGDYPELFEQPERLEPLAFEEYRLRGCQGDLIRKQEYADRYGIDVTYWPELGPENSQQSTGDPDNRDSWREFSGSEPASAAQTIAARRTLPQAGERFGSFELVVLLGEGAFGRVFLARQHALAERLVALKITVGRPTEAQKLARLQHGNIMPVYSVHRRGKLAGICMPYLGSVTLADLVAGLKQHDNRLRTAESLVKTLESRRAELSTIINSNERLPASAKSKANGSAVDRVRESLGTSLEQFFTQVMQKVAGGLAQAHERGIVHRDLKPANILISDDGEPLLLDFNLAEEQSGHAARIGGTLPYMSPEQLRQFQGEAQPLDGRSDVFALGVVLYECLAARHPFPIRQGALDEVVQQMLLDRQTAPVNVRHQNPAVSPGLAAMVHRCLQPDPTQRYQSAAELREDLRCHLENRPLRYTRNTA